MVRQYLGAEQVRILSGHTGNALKVLVAVIQTWDNRTSEQYLRPNIVQSSDVFHYEYIIGFRECPVLLRIGFLEIEKEKVGIR